MGLPRASGGAASDAELEDAREEQGEDKSGCLETRMEGEMCGGGVQSIHNAAQLN